MTTIDSMIIACAECHKLNRVPKDKLTANGTCGSCKAPLFGNKPIIVTQGNIANHITKSDLPMIIDFWAPWCGPCKMMAPVLEQAAKQFEPRLRIGKVDTEKEQILGQQYQIRSIPTLVLFYKGKEIDRISGAMNFQQLDQWANSKLATLRI